MKKAMREAKLVPPTLIRLVLAPILAMATATSAPCQALKTTEQMTTLKPAAANRTVRSDLLSVLRPVDEISTGMRVQLQGVPLTTRAYGTQYDGLCRKDALWLKYAPTNLEADEPKQPLQPYGVEASALFHATSAPTLRSEDAPMQEDVWNKGCDRLTSDEDIIWFEAKDAELAAAGVNALLAALDQINAGTLKAKICSKFPGDARSCEDIVLEDGKLD